MHDTIARLYWKKDPRHLFHLEKSTLMSLTQLKIRLEQDAWAVRRLLESSDLYRQNFSSQLNRLIKNLIKSQSYYQQGRVKRIIEK